MKFTFALMASISFAIAAHSQNIKPVSSDVTTMEGHMSMTKLRPPQPGDKERAAAIVVAARKVADQYLDYRKALAEGYTIFMPNVPQHVYHFTLAENAIEAMRQFDASRPTSLLYEKIPNKKPGDEGYYKLIGVMYTDRLRASEDELNNRVPLSVATWHLHTNLCMPAGGSIIDMTGPNPRFGLNGSITTKEACEAAGGRFQGNVFGWMVHVYPFETDPKKIWQAGMDDDHGMQHDAAMPGMKMP
jgi:hypothetical protein